MNIVFGAQTISVRVVDWQLKVGIGIFKIFTIQYNIDISVTIQYFSNTFDDTA